MSRTDKDAPHWVRAEYYEAWHDWNCPDRIARAWQKYPKGTHSCTLPETPVHINPRLSVRRKFPRTIPEVPECEWVAIWLRPWQGGYYCYRRPRSQDRHVYWYGPDRAHTRDVLAKAKRQYNGSGDVDIIEPTVRPRHAMYAGGWWG